MPPKTGKPSHSASKSPKRKSKGALDDETSEVNILSPDANLNAYYICHTVADCLDARGYPWDGAAKGKKKKKK